MSYGKNNLSKEILLIDNYDSFTYNLYQYLEELGYETLVVRNDQITTEEIRALSRLKKIIISPGPGVPADSGISLQVIQEFHRTFPLLGVCLGHQAIVTVFGGVVRRAEKIMHGKVSQIYHDGRFIYSGIKNPFSATRYHSLIAEQKTLPECFTVNASTRDGEIMGVHLKGFPCFGVQYHPESILTGEGKKILLNFLKL